MSYFRGDPGQFGIVKTRQSTRIRTFVWSKKLLLVLQAFLFSLYVVHRSPTAMRATSAAQCYNAPIIGHKYKCVLKPVESILEERGDETLFPDRAEPDSSTGRL